MPKRVQVEMESWTYILRTSGNFNIFHEKWEEAWQPSGRAPETKRASNHITPATSSLHVYTRQLSRRLSTSSRTPSISTDGYKIHIRGP